LEFFITPRTKSWSRWHSGCPGKIRSLIKIK
jgi:hypothetical protein